MKKKSVEGGILGKFGVSFLVLLEKYHSVFIGFILALSAFNFFYKLGGAQIFEWDEARNGVSACEMIRGDHYFLTTYRNQPDLWNLKPLLGFWLIALGYKLWGFNAFGLRFSSALMSLLSVGLLIWMTKKEAGKLAAVVAGAVLATSIPFSFLHGSRSGEFSSALAFFSLAALFSIWKWEEKPVFPALAGFCFALAFLVYGAAAFQILGWVFFYWIWSRKLWRLSGRSLGMFFLCAALPILIWIFLRYQQVEGAAFLRRMFSYDLLERFAGAIEEHYSYPWFYLGTLLESNRHWTLYLLVLVFFFWKTGEREGRNGWIILVGSTILIPLLIFSAAQTRLGWYIHPLYGPLAMVTGWLAWRVLKGRDVHPAVRGVLLILFLAAFMKSEHTILQRIRHEPVSAAQNLLREWKAKGAASGSVVFCRPWFQDNAFVAEVECGWIPRTENGKENIPKSGDFFLLKKTEEDLGFVQLKGLRVLHQNEGWMIAQVP